MNLLLESYLEDARQNLAHLPDWKRDLELMELRSHLEADVAARVELGDAEEIATHEALVQFGDARAICGGLEQAHRREYLSRLDSPSGATALTTVLYLIIGAISHVVAVSWIAFFLKHQTLDSLAVTGSLMAGIGFMSRMAVAWLVGRLTPRNGVMGAAFGFILSWALTLVTSPLSWSLSPGVKVMAFGPDPLSMALSGLCFVALAWLSSRQTRALALGKALL